MVRTIADMQGVLDGSPRWHQAVYLEQEIPEYRNNPFIEALPPMADDIAALDAMQVLVEATSAEREWPAHLRRHLIARIRNLHQPFEPHLELFHTVSIMIRQGYVKRNPLNRQYIREMTAIIEEMERTADKKQTYKIVPTAYAAPSGSLLGLSGVGKTRAIERVLAAFGPQVVQHPELSGPIGMTMQAVFIRVTCSEGSVRSLCADCVLALDNLLGTDYARLHTGRAATADSLRAALARLAWLHGLGLIVVDEVNNLLNAKGDAAESVKNYFKVLADVVGVPVLVVGTEQASAVLADFQSGRRYAGMPEMKPLPLFGTLEAAGPGQPATRIIDPYFRFICEGLFEAQFVRHPVPVDEELLLVLHELSFGILGVLVPLFIAAQQRALSSGKERLSAALFREVYEDSFQLLHGHLQLLRNPQRGRRINRAKFDADLRVTAERYSESALDDISVPIHGQAAEPLSTPEPSSGTGAPPVVAKRNKKKTSVGKASKSLLVQVVREGTERSQSGWEALVQAGHVRGLGAEVVD